MIKLKRKLKTAIITWIAVYPLITTLLYFFEPILSQWPMPLRTLFLTAVLVPTMDLWAMPHAKKLFQKFLGDKMSNN